MILKTLSHDKGDSDCWNYYDNIMKASIFYNEKTKQSCISVRFRDANEDIVFTLYDTAYLCNDKGQTITTLGPVNSSI